MKIFMIVIASLNVIGALVNFVLEERRRSIGRNFYGSGTMPVLGNGWVSAVLGWGLVLLFAIGIL